jgi:hypothetical protein
VAQSGSAPGWGPGGRRFKSCLPDADNSLQIGYFIRPELGPHNPSRGTNGEPTFTGVPERALESSRPRSPEAGISTSAITRFVGGRRHGGGCPDYLRRELMFTLVGAAERGGAASRASPRCSRPRGHRPRLLRPIRESAGSARAGRVGSGQRGLGPRPIGSSRRAAQRSPQRSAVDPRHTARRLPDQQRRSAIGPRAGPPAVISRSTAEYIRRVAVSATRRRQSALTLGCRVENAAAGTRSKEGWGR